MICMHLPVCWRMEITAQLLLLLLVALGLQGVASAQGVQLVFQGERVANHGFVLRGQIGEADEDTVMCMTDNTTCCSSGGVGNWFFPNGNSVLSEDAGTQLYRTRGPQVVRLHRRDGGVKGIYHCRIADASGTNQDLYVGLYASSTGQPRVTSVDFSLASELNAQTPTFTLTCISEGGPVEGVIWNSNTTGNNTPLQDGSTYDISGPTVVDTVSAIYHHTLTVTGRLPDIYTCRALSRRPVSAGGIQLDAMSIGIVAADPPTIVSVDQVGITATVRVTWTPPTGGATGYRIYYTGGFRDVGNGGATEDTFTLLEGTYTITMVALSQHLPSTESDSVTVTVIGIEITSPPQPLTVGGMATFSCTADLTVSSIQWLFSGEVVADTSGQQFLELTFDPINDTIHERQYTCVLTHNSSVVFMENITINVTVPLPALEVSITAPGGTPEAGQEYTLTCTVSEIVVGLTNMPTLQWLDPMGNVIPSGPGDITVGDEVTNATAATLSLTFPTLRTSHGGNYTCQARLESPAVEGGIMETEIQGVVVQIPTPAVSVAVPDGPLYSGTEVNLTCTVELNEAVNTMVDVSVVWTGPGDVSTDGRITLSEEVAASPPTFVATLTFCPLASVHNGSYVCEASVTPDPDSSFIIMNTSTDTGAVSVTALPVPEVQITPAGSSFAGENYTLTCTVEVEEGLVVTWLDEEGNPVSGENIAVGSPETEGTITTLTLMFRPLHTSHGGRYTCMASVTVDEVEISNRNNSDMIDVIVGIPPPTVTVDSEAGTLYAGTPSTLTCSIELNPAVDTGVAVIMATWTGPGGNTIDNSGRFNVSDVTGSNLMYEATLRFNPLNTTDSGSYSCAATVSPDPSSAFITMSAPGSDSEEITVEALPAPTVNITTMGTSTAGQQYTLTCTVTVVENLVVQPVVEWSPVSGEDITVGMRSVMQSRTVQFTRALTFNTLHTSHGGEYTCLASITIAPITTDLSSEQKQSVRVQIPSPMVSVSRDPPDGPLPGGSSVTFTCDITLAINTAVDTGVTAEAMWMGPSRIRDLTSSEANMMQEQIYQSTIMLNHLQTSDSGVYTCKAKVMPASSSESTFVVNNEQVSETVQIVVELVVSISIDYTPPPDAVLGPNDYRAASRLTITCEVQGATGAVTYTWSPETTLAEVTGEPESRQRLFLRSTHSGVQTCTATDSDSGDNSGTASITVNVVGIGVQIIVGDVDGDGVSDHTAVLPNNGLVFSLPVTSGNRFRIICYSESLQDDVVEIIGLDGASVTTDPFTVTDDGPGGRKISSTVDIDMDDQGVYTCRLPDSSGTQMEANFGLYRSDFNNTPYISNFTFDPTTRTLTCNSTGSPATNVTWRKDGVVLTVDGTNYSMTQRITNRRMSTYQNILTIAIGDRVTDFIGVYNCTVSNVLGNSLRIAYASPVVAQIHSSGSGVVGEMYSLTCTVMLVTGTDVEVQWTGPGVEMDGVTESFSGLIYTLTFASLRESHGGQYICNATLPTDAISDSDTTTVTTTRPTVSVEITASSAGTPTVGDSYTLTCSVSGADNLQPTISYQWTDSNGITVFNVVSTLTQSVLSFSSLALSNASRYTCEVTVSSVLLSSDITGLSDMMDLRVQIPPPTIAITGGTGILTAGSVLTLTCTFTLNPVLESILSDLTVSSVWSGPVIIGSTGRVSQTGAVEDPSDDRVFRNTLTFNPLHSSGDGGTYTCQAIVSPSSASTFGVNMNITVQNPTLTADLEANTTRLPTHPDYNTFSLTCTAAAPIGVVTEKTFTWRQELNGGSFTTLSDNGGSIQIETTNIDQEVSTSVLTVRETTAGQHTYRCVAAFSDDGIVLFNTSTDDRRIDVDIIVTGPRNPLQPQSVTATGITFERATIQWTVLPLAYTPETYVVEYGTDSSSLDLRSQTKMSGADFTATNLMFSVTLTGLTHDTEYFYRVNANNTQGSTRSNMDMFMTPDIPPDPPRNFRITVEGPTNLTFSWDAPDLARGNPSDYDLTCTPTLSGIEVVEVTFPVPDLAESRSETLTNFEEGVTYNCTLRSTNDQGSSDLVYARATTNPIAPSGPPQMFTVTAEGPRSLLFTWRAPDPEDRNGNITSYTLTCSPPAPSVTFYHTFDTDIGNDMFDRSLSGFTPFTDYTCTLNATNSVGNSPAATDTVTTPQDVPGSPRTFAHVTTPSDTTIVVFFWDSPAEPNGIITSYIIRCLPTLTNLTDVVFNTTTNEMTTAVSGFTPTSRYNCTIAAYTIVGEGPGTDGLIVITLPAAPEGVMVMNDSCSELRVQFEVDPLHSEISQYRIYASFNETDGSPQTMVYNCSGTQDPMAQCTCSDTQGPVVECTIGGLPLFTDVEVEVAGVNSAGGEGPRSAPDTERTLEGFPGEVSGPFWEHQTDTSVNVSWGKPAMPNGVILGYRVTLQRYEGGETETVDVGETVYEVEFRDEDHQDVELEAGIPYNVTVVAVNTAVQNMMPCENLMLGEATTTNFTEEESPDIAPNVTATDRFNGTHLMITWKPLSLVEARGFVTSYTISYQPSSSMSKRQQPTDHSVPQDQSSAVVGGLNPEQGYLMNVWANTSAGKGPSTIYTVPAFSTPGGETNSAVGIAGGVVVGGLLLAAVCVILIMAAVWWLRRHGRLQFSDKPRHKSYRGGIVAESGDPGVAIELTAPEGPLEKPGEDEYLEDTTFLISQRLKAIPVKEFNNHVVYMHQDRDRRFEMEYRSIGKHPLSSVAIAEIPHNKCRNRFGNIFPYDFNRVKLQELPGVEGSDYINASFLDGYTKKKAYIAAQGPAYNTITDSWRMIWEYRLPTIVMLTRCFEAGKEKCQKYWPGDSTLTPGCNLSVTLTSVLPFAEYEMKKLVVKDTSKPEEPPLEVTHLHYLAWPDHGVPSNAMALITFIKRVRKLHPVTYDKPLLVHCSAGVGRTGTFIVLDSMLERMKVEGNVDIFNFLKKLRAQRVHMVQTESQYVFIHDALNQLINCGETEIAAANLRITTNRLNKTVQGKQISGFQNQFELLEQVSQGKVKDADYSEAMAPYNLVKNRYANKLPNDTTRVRLRPSAVHGSDYINASFIDGYRQSGAYIATQGPLQDTVNDFWRMMWEYQSKVIVMLCNLREDEVEVCHRYWPREQGSSEVYGRLKVVFQSERPHQDYIIRKLEISEDKPTLMPEERTVKLFQYTKWPRWSSPASISSLLEFTNSVTKEQMSSGNKAIVVMCNDGVGRTGTFISIHTQLERLKTEGLVDFFQFIKLARIHRAGMVQTVEQYMLCHDVLADYVDTFETYANFKDVV